MFLFLLLIAVAGLVGWYYLNENVLLPQKVRSVEKALEEGSYDEALRLIDALPESRKDTPEMNWNLYKIYLYQTQYVKALDHLAQILKKASWNERISELSVHMASASIYEIMQKPKRAIEEYESVLAIDPEHPLANMKVGENLFNLKNFGAARPALEKAMGLLTESAQPARLLAEIAVIEKDWSKALVLVDHCLSMGETGADLHLCKAQAIYALGRHEETLAEVEMAKSDPVGGNLAHLLKGLALSKMGRFSEAKDTLSQGLLRMAESYADFVLEARYEYADLLAREGQIKESLRQLYLVRNSGTPMKDVADRIAIFSQVANSKTVSDLFESKDIDEILRDKVAKWLSLVGYAIQRTVSPEAHRLMFIVKKSAAGQNLRTGIGFDLTFQPTPETLMRSFLELLEKQELSTGSFFSLFGLSEGAQAITAASPVEVTLYGLKDFESILKGQKPL